MNKAPNSLSKRQKKGWIFLMDKYSQQPVVIMKKKQSIFTKIKNWWRNLGDEQRDTIKLVGASTAEGLICGIGIGAAIAGVKTKRMEREVEIAAAKGYIIGSMDAYKDVATSNPYSQMDQGMKRLEKQGIAKKF